MFDPISNRPAHAGSATVSARPPLRCSRRVWISIVLAAGLAAQFAAGAAAQSSSAASASQPSAAQQARQLPPRVLAARRFLALRGVAPGRRAAARSLPGRRFAAAQSAHSRATPMQSSTSSSTSDPTWTPLGPAAVITPTYGLVSGRITAAAIDPSDPTGNRVYLGTTGGGVWSANKAASSTAAGIVFTPLTDGVTALGGATDASISIGALTVQPGGTGVILAGTGDPNDVLDSYYGAGILYSTDSGHTWSLIDKTSDAEDSLGTRDVYFTGEGFSGFAWCSPQASTAAQCTPQTVVAAVASSYESEAVDAELPTLNSEGLYYSNDSGATWHLATIADGNGAVLQSPANPLLGPNGNAATSVVWNPVRQVFIAAIRFHGYYESSDGVTWTRLPDQPGPGLTTALCPTNPGIPGSEGCPIFRGALAVNPVTGDTFAWTVDLNNQDQGLWQDKCAISNSGQCTNAAMTFAQQLNTTALESDIPDQGAATIADGNYNLTLAAIPSQQDTVVLAGAHDLWKCSVYSGCQWRDTTNSSNAACTAGVGEFQHALTWNLSNPLEIFIGNDSGLWRSTDGIAESGPVCNSTDATHFQNLNGQFYSSYQDAGDNTPGSLAEVESLSSFEQAPYTLMAGLGVNGAAGVKAAAVTNDWPQILSGFGGPVAIDPSDNSNWYVNDQPGVAIYRCSQSAPCAPSDFGSAPAVTDADVGGDGDTMPVPAAFIVDPLDNTQLLVATCRIWRGPASGGWTQANEISQVFSSQVSNGPCAGNALIRSIAAIKIGPDSEVIYVGMYGSATNGSILPGHVWRGVYNASTGAATWNDLTLSPVSNDQFALNYFGLDISSIVIDPHDPTGNTVYLTVEGMPNYTQGIQVAYRSTSGGASWSTIAANLPDAPASSLAVDPQDANTVYIATDLGVFYTPEVANCALHGSMCWAPFGTGLPAAPAVALAAAPASSPSQVLVAATYGRGIWQAPLRTANSSLSAASVSPASLTFAGQASGTISQAQAVTLLNTGSANLILASTSPIVFTGDFSESGDTCQNQTIAPGASCAISVVFAPQSSGPLTGQMTIYANIYGGQISVDLNGTGTAAPLVTLSPSTLPFGQVEAGSQPWKSLSVSVANGANTAVPITGITVTPPFVISGNSCGTSSLAPSNPCEMQIEFAPTTAGNFTGLLTMTDSYGTQTVLLSGTALAPPTDIINPPEPSSLTFPKTVEGQLSTPLAVTITNTGGMALNGVTISVSGPFEQTPNCGTQLAAGAVCTVNVVFAPTQTGSFTGTLTIADALRTQTVSLSGTGVTPPVLSVVPTSLTFTNQQPGVASAPQTVTVTNTGATPIANIEFTFTGPAATNYSSTSNCGTSLAGGANCTAQIVFTPGSAGSSAATLTVSTSTSGVSPVSIPINGAGQLSSGLTVSPAQLNFSLVPLGNSSAAQSVTITNSTGYTIDAVTISAPAPFSVAQNTCSGGLAAGASCTASVAFTPTGGGTATGTLTVSSSSITQPASIGLSGTGFSFTVSVSGSSSQSVVRGQTASYTLVITPNGATSGFTFACGTLPAGALCLFNPTTETLNSGVQGNVQVEVSTSGATARLERPDFGQPRFARPGPWRALPLACGVLLLPFALRRRRRIFQLLLLFAVLVCGVSSCTSSSKDSTGSSGQGNGTGTPTGPYKITVNVSAAQTNLTQPAELFLTVD
jgi:hypothetical protein